jgi:3-methyladenine DNA glycosylase/8-oxoguanine DNA glycosylase
VPLRGAGGEPISFIRTIHSHGCARLPPASVHDSPPSYRRAFRVGKRVVDVAMRANRGTLIAETPKRIGRRESAAIEGAIARMFRFDDDLSPFYAQIAGDAAMSWAANGAGRILASPTVFEDVVKTICTTNCAWSATVRMTRALVELGEGAFPEPDALASAPDSWYRDTARMGYRDAYIKAIARDVASGALDLESLVDRGRHSDEETEETLLALPGIGPYGAAHVMQLVGRHRALVLDSWTRPKYRRLAGKKNAADSTIRRAFARYGKYAGLAFWLYLTRDWLDEGAAAQKSDSDVYA